MVIAARVGTTGTHDYTADTAESLRSLADEGIGEAERLVEEVVGETSAPTYENTIQPLDDLSAVLSRTFGRTGILRFVHPDGEVREAALAIDERINKFRVALPFRDDLRERVQAFAGTDEAAALEPVRRRLLDLWLREFRRAGGDLGAEQRAELARIKDRLVELEAQFQRNIDEHEDWLDLTRDELDGMDDEWIARLKPGEKPGTLRVSLDYPDYFPFMEGARRRDLRAALELKHLTRALSVNRPLLEEAVALRGEAARLLGYPSWAHYRVETKMAGTPEAIDQFHGEIVPPLSEKARAELANMLPLLHAEYPGADFRSWDRTYYTEQLRKRDFDVDQAEVAKYLPLGRVLDGLLELTGEVFGVDYRQIPDAKAWHPDVLLYEVTERGSGRLIGHFYADLFPRDAKFGHAMAVPTRVARIGRADGDEQPISTIVVSFTKPTADSPSLLRHDEVVTLFHEFGHVLEMVLARPAWAELDMQWAEWDFVEAPSQIMEHWAWSPEILHRFARHHATGEPVPADLVERLVAGRFLSIGLATLQTCYGGIVDMRMHDASEPKDLDAIYREAWAVTLMPFHEGAFRLAGWGHPMAGYDAGYYGYLWAQVYGDDMFSRFEEGGLTSADVGRDYRREILETTGSKPAIDRVRAFLRREPSNEAFLRNIGIGQT